MRAGGRSRKVYVVTAPASISGIYDTWDACRAAVSGVAGARYQGVSSRAVAEAMLRGEGLRLEPGAYAFVDGNGMGGIGAVLVEQGEAGPVSVRDISTTVYDVFGRAGIPSLDTRSKITGATDGLQNILAELGALHAALQETAPGSALTVVHDYEGVGAWLEGRWKAKNPIVADVVAAARALIEARRLRVRFRHQRGHESTFAGRNDFAAYNARADKLATEAALRLA
ncbi:MAG TPA: ribonuclease H family protein [Methylomirabilota bacterium]